ncbi:DinI-like family protein [Photobacterium damselae]|uniref:DinI-like family protein n=1 Tax=Photobacterium damselae TaxID=38293 RepID=UPI0010FE0F6F|nr:DinI-like family protein [Photobacterium damselae]KAB1512024.1 DinI family protein [Photobacterium damselae subsp. damselae]TLS72168.1 DinI family protein [Photobacterium damselae subsp. damselae]TLS80250.1 DinI family protein [Photobacterium damselae subsp. damselae]TLS82913.1 DinI family protein [Photobacterium damselae subsp. damselae]
MIRIDLQIPKEGAGLPKDGIELIESELDHRIHCRWPDALIRVRRGTNTNLSISGTVKDEKEAISQIIEEMFDEAADWLYVQ